MTNKPKPDSVALKVNIPAGIKRAAELQTISNKHKPGSGPTTLTDLVIAALEDYLEEPGLIQLYEERKAQGNEIIPFARAMDEIGYQR